MADGDRISLKVDPHSERKVKAMLERLLAEGRRQGPAIIKRLARNVANSAAKLTIPNKGRNTPTAGGRSSVRKPRMADKMRPLVSTKEIGRGNFYVVNSVANRKSKRKRKRRANGFTGEGGRSRVMRGSRGELVFYTTKKISQKDGRFTRVKKAIKAWDKKRKSWRWFPSMAGGKYDRQSPQGKIPHYFTAKQGWLWSVRPIVKTFKKLNPSATRRGYMTNRLKRKDNPGLIMHNTSNYAAKSGGTMVPRKAVELGIRGFNKSLKRQAELKMLKAAKKGG